MKTLTLATAILVLAGAGFAQDDPAPRPQKAAQTEKTAVRDVGKKAVERPLLREMDLRKAEVEMPVKKALKPQPGKGENKVRWHASVEKALEAAKKSGRPVMVFQLLGLLDEEFC